MNVKQKWKGSHLLISLIVAMLVGLIMTVAVAAIGTYLISSEKVSENAVDTIAVLSILLSSLTASFIVIGREQGTRLVSSFLGGAIYFLGLMAVAALAYDGVSTGVGITVLLVLCGSATAWLMGFGKGKKQKIRVPKLRI